MEISNEAIICIIIALVCFFILSLSFPGILHAREKFEPEPMMNVIVVEKPLVSVSTEVVGDEYKYKIDLSGIVKYVGKSEELGEGIEVIPLLSFKNVDKKASVRSGNKIDNKFPLTKRSLDFEGTIYADILSKIPRIKEVGKEYNEKIKEYESLLLNSDEGNFSVAFEPENTFFVKCEKDSERIELDEWSECEKTKEYSECEKYLEVCGGTVHIRLNSISGDEADVEIKVENGKYDAGDEVEISFWKRTKCTEAKNNYKDLVFSCEEDFLGWHSIIVPKIPLTL